MAGAARAAEGRGPANGSGFQFVETVATPWGKFPQVGRDLYQVLDAAMLVIYNLAPFLAVTGFARWFALFVSMAHSVSNLMTDFRPEYPCLKGLTFGRFHLKTHVPIDILFGLSCGLMFYGLTVEDGMSSAGYVIYGGTFHAFVIFTPLVAGRLF
uniref:Uncharacterized protein n=1 Tax=Alexandrium monilatum TaxID=311494 RepID=A0A7S4Q4Z8_9DINO